MRHAAKSGAKLAHKDTGKSSTANRKIVLLSPGALTPNENNARLHSKAQIHAIASSISAFGFTVPILADDRNVIIAGHGRWEAAQLLRMTVVPVIHIRHMTQAQIDAYMLADNKLADRSGWNDIQVAKTLKSLSEIALGFEIEATGFEQPEIDIRIGSLEDPNAAETADDFEVRKAPAVSTLGDVWLLGPHKICCGSALDVASYAVLFGKAKAAAAFSDAPYNVPIAGHASGRGKIKHREFAMGAGEMSAREFTDFLSTSMANMCRFLVPGALLYACTDWRHLVEMHTAGRASGCDAINLCIWAKSRGGMGSMYRSQHELVYVFRSGKAPHINNVQLGRFGRARSNVWSYPGVNTFTRHELRLHPTVKPVRLVADALLDSTRPNDVVLDPFLGSGTTILAAERTKRRCFGIELDPLYVDTAVERWQQITNLKAHNQTGESYDQIKTRRVAE